MKRIYTLLAILLSAACVWANKNNVTVTAGTTQTVTAGNTYTLIATSEDTPTEFTLTTNWETNGKTIDDANLVIQTNIGGTTEKQGDVIVTLKNFWIQDAAPVHVHGSGTVTFKILSATRFINTAKKDGITIHAPDDAHLRFEITDGVVVQISIPTSNYGAVNIRPIVATNVTFIGGETHLFAISKGDSVYGADYPLTPCVDVKECLTIYGEKTSLDLRLFAGTTITKSEAATIATKQLSPLKYGTLQFTSGSITDSGTAFPTSGGMKTGTRYKYPEKSRTNLIADAKGGTVFGTVIEPKLKTFSFPNWEDFSTTAADYIACFKSATTGDNPTEEAITIDAENKTIIINTTLCPDPEIVCTETGRAGAISLFGVNPTLTENGMQVSYNFGIDWIGIENGTIQMTVAVDLPNETADTKELEFFITVTTEDSETIFKDNLTFTRIEGTNRFRSTRIDDTKNNPYGTGFTFHKYRVSASEAKSETE